MTVGMNGHPLLLYNYRIWILNQRSSNILPFLSLLKDGSNSLSSYCTSWREAAINNPKFRDAQDKVVDDLYWGPSQIIASDLGLKLAVSSAILYDAAIQHGLVPGDEDGLRMFLFLPPYD